MEGFLAALDLGEEQDIRRATGRDYTTDAVQLMTLHGAKGLEFPVVFLARGQPWHLTFGASRRDPEHQRGTPSVFCGNYKGKRITDPHHGGRIIAFSGRTPLLHPRGNNQSSYSEGRRTHIVLKAFRHIVTFTESTLLSAALIFRVYISFRLLYNTFWVRKHHSEYNHGLTLQSTRKGKTMKKILEAWNRISLVKQIILGLIVGIILAVAFPDQLSGISIFGELFVGALKAVAPVLVLFLVTSAIAQHQKGQKTNMKSIIILYMVGTLCASITAVIASFIVPVELVLTTGAGDVTPPEGITEVLTGLVTNIVANPISALADANYIGILAWAILLGLALKAASDSTQNHGNGHCQRHLPAGTLGH